DHVVIDHCRDNMMKAEMWKQIQSQGFLRLSI
ncbi:hypothetical protein F441_17136, partial [Phytophthora nicotianae CJ01A1]